VAQLASQITDYRKLVSFRNVRIHGYAVDDDLVRDIVETRIHTLREEIGLIPLDEPKAQQEMRRLQLVKSAVDRRGSSVRLCKAFGLRETAGEDRTTNRCRKPRGQARRDCVDYARGFGDKLLYD
jgi:Protein of unknown function DUF86